MMMMMMIQKRLVKGLKETHTHTHTSARTHTRRRRENTQKERDNSKCPISIGKYKCAHGGLNGPSNLQR